MAEIIPLLSQTEISKIPSKAEQKVYKGLLEQLPKSWLVIHSLEFIAENKFKGHGDREADFVVFAPEYGVLVIEVKGGGISYNEIEKKWHSINRNGKTFNIKNPLKQAKNAKYEIRNHLKQKIGNKNFLMAHGALFPDVKRIEKLTNPNIDKAILGGVDALRNLKSWIISVFKFWAGEKPIFEKLDSFGIKAAKELYGKSITIEPTLASAIEEEIEKQIVLTNRQKSILRQLKKRKEAIIEGGAGTGKTVLALDHAFSLSNQGLKVLLLCYNRKLGDDLAQKAKGIKGLNVMSFHQFCTKQIKLAKGKSGRDLLIEAEIFYEDGDKFDELMPSALIESFTIVPADYDAIIVDEGQDFLDSYWLAIEELRAINLDCKLYIFKDSNQAIFTLDNDLPIDTEPLFLFDNCRNTKYIHNLAYKYYEGEEIEEPSVIGEPVEFLMENTLEEQANAIDKTVANLINNEDIKVKDIAIITLNHFDTAKEYLQNSRHNKLWSFKEDNKNKILVESAKRFKGLESNIVLLWILDSSYLNEAEKLLYVSISRARFRLFVVGDGNINKI